MRLFEDIFHSLVAVLVAGVLCASCTERIGDEIITGMVGGEIIFGAEVAEVEVKTRSENGNSECGYEYAENGEGNFVAVVETAYSSFGEPEPTTRTSEVMFYDLRTSGFYVSCFTSDTNDATLWNSVWDGAQFSLITNSDPDYQNGYYYYKGGKIWPGSDPGYHFIANNLAPLSHDGSDYYLDVDNTFDTVVCILEDSVYPTRYVKSNSLRFNHVLGRLKDVSVTFDTGVTVSNFDMWLVAADGGRYHVRTGEWTDLNMVKFEGIANADGTTKTNDIWLVPGTYDVLMTYDYIMYGVERTGRSACSRVTVNAGQIASISVFFTEEEEPLTFEAIGSGTFRYEQPSSLSYSSNDRVDMSINGGEWVTYFASHNNNISVSAGDKIRVRNPYTYSLKDSRFNSDCGMYAYGNIGSLVYASSQVNKRIMNRAFMNLFLDWTNLHAHPVKNLKFPVFYYSENACKTMFSGCTSLERTPEIHALTASDSAFEQMFRECTSLTEVSDIYIETLPTSSQYQCRDMFLLCSSIRKAGVVGYGGVSTNGYGTANSTFAEMFRGCSSLVKAPTLPQTDLTNTYDVYGNMFQDCTSLVVAPELPATTLARYCYGTMFSGCTALEQAPVLPATTLDYYAYSGMFYNCSSLVSAPALPAMNLGQGCYYGMFEGCTSLVSAPELPATMLTSSCYNGMFKGCTSLVNTYDLPATTLEGSCYANMFYGCTSLVDAPAISAQTLANSCCSYMFYNCSSLVNAPELNATTLMSNCYSYMFTNCRSLRNAPVLPALTLVSGCYNFMFNGCSVLSYIKAMFTTTPSTSYTNNWVGSVRSSSQCIFVKNSAATWNVRGVNGIPNSWTIQTASN